NPRNSTHFVNKLGEDLKKFSERGAKVTPISWGYILAALVYVMNPLSWTVLAWTMTIAFATAGYQLYQLFTPQITQLYHRFVSLAGRVRGPGPALTSVVMFFLTSILPVLPADNDRPLNAHTFSTKEGLIYIGGFILAIVSLYGIHGFFKLQQYLKVRKSARNQYYRPKHPMKPGLKLGVEPGAFGQWWARVTDRLKGRKIYYRNDYRGDDSQSRRGYYVRMESSLYRWYKKITGIFKPTKRSPVPAYHEPEGPPKEAYTEISFTDVPVWMAMFIAIFGVYAGSIFGIVGFERSLIYPELFVSTAIVLFKSPLIIYALTAGFAVLGWTLLAKKIYGWTYRFGAIGYGFITVMLITGTRMALDLLFPDVMNQNLVPADLSDYDLPLWAEVTRDTFDKSFPILVTLVIGAFIVKVAFLYFYNTSSARINDFHLGDLDIESRQIGVRVKADVAGGDPNLPWHEKTANTGDAMIVTLEGKGLSRSQLETIGNIYDPLIRRETGDYYGNAELSDPESEVHSLDPQEAVRRAKDFLADEGRAGRIRKVKSHESAFVYGFALLLMVFGQGAVGALIAMGMLLLQMSATTKALWQSYFTKMENIAASHLAALGIPFLFALITIQPETNEEVILRWVLLSILALIVAWFTGFLDLFLTFRST
ncbi:MAG: hypothetical protein KC713_09980, partial [Candidatus Omnitrophica bacterium]|nr:hypothetical protein [Candidatus Omnitrophota bacterium]